MISVPQPDAGTDRRSTRVFLALLLAMVLAWVGGSWTSVELGNLGESADRGLLGVSAERSEADTLPDGKPVNEAVSEGAEESESEREDLAEPLVATLAARAAFEGACQVDTGRPESDATSPERAWLGCSNVGARGPPVG
ncbi:hypothetical protein ACNOYE_15270 [Nannocystaceae bacterium ST9]